MIPHNVVSNKELTEKSLSNSPLSYIFITPNNQEIGSSFRYFTAKTHVGTFVTLGGRLW